MTEKESFIQLKKDSILRIGIKDSEGKDTGEHLEFDLEDFELPLKINKCEALHRKNREYIKNQFIAIDKREDKKGKYILSRNEEEKIKLMKEYYIKEMEALDLFLGEGGTKKLLNGRPPYYTMYEDIDEILTPIMPLLKQNKDQLMDKIMKKYDMNKEGNTLE